MKKLALLLALPLVLAACGGDESAEQSAEITTPDAADIIETAPVEVIAEMTAPVVSSIADGATSSRMPTVIAGTVDPATVKVSINGFQLTRFVPNSGAFTYLASTEFGTMQAGANSYEIVAENAAGEIASTTFGFIYQPAE